MATSILQYEILERIILYLALTKPKALLELRRTCKTILEITELEMVLNATKVGNDKELCQKAVRNRMPDFMARFKEDLGAPENFKYRLTEVIFHTSPFKWLYFTRPTMTTLQYFENTREPPFSDDNMFERKTKYKCAYLNLSSSYRKYLKWQLKYSTLINKIQTRKALRDQQRFYAPA